MPRGFWVGREYAEDPCDKRVVVLLNEALLGKLGTLTDAFGMKRSELLRDLIDQAFERLQKDESSRSNE